MRTTSLLSLIASDAAKPYAESLANYKKLLFPWEYYEESAKTEAEQKGGMFITTDQQSAIDRYMELEKQGEINA